MQDLVCSDFLCLRMTFPMSSAKQIEASLPDGSIRAYNKSYADSTSPAYNQAEVPGVQVIQSGTLYMQFLRSTSYFLPIIILKQQVIILLRDAISMVSSAFSMMMGQNVYKFSPKKALAVIIFLSTAILGGFYMLSLSLFQSYIPPASQLRYPFLYFFFYGTASTGQIWNCERYLLKTEGEGLLIYGFDCYDFSSFQGDIGGCVFFLLIFGITSDFLNFEPYSVFFYDSQFFWLCTQFYTGNEPRMLLQQSFRMPGGLNYKLLVLIFFAGVFSVLGLASTTFLIYKDGKTISSYSQSMAWRGRRISLIWLL